VHDGHHPGEGPKVFLKPGIYLFSQPTSDNFNTSS